MPNKKITAMPDLAAGQVSGDLLTLVDLSAAPASQNVKSSLTNFFANMPSASLFAFNADVRTSGSSNYFRVKTPADTTLAASTESVGVQIAGSAAGGTVTRQFATGNIATQREIVCVAPTYGFVGASTITTAATLAVTGAPVAGTNATITANFAVLIQGGSLGLPQGSASAPAIRDATDTTTATGFYFRSSGGTASIDAVTGSTVRFALNQNGFQILSSGQYAISGGDPAVTAPDIGLSRPTAGVFRVTDGSTGIGALTRARRTVAATGTTTVATTDSDTVFSNEGAVALATFNLPTATAQLTYTFIVQDTDGIRVVAATGDTIRLGASVSATAGRIDSTSIGSAVILVAINATEWIAISIVGTWSVT